MGLAPAFFTATFLAGFFSALGAMASRGWCGRLFWRPGRLLCGAGKREGEPPEAGFKPPQQAVFAAEQVQAAVSSAQPATMSGRGKGKGKGTGKTSVTRSAKAGLQFPVGRIARCRSCRCQPSLDLGSGLRDRQRPASVLPVPSWLTSQLL